MNKKLKIILIVLIVLTIILCIAAFFMLSNKDTEKESNDSKDEFVTTLNKNSGVVMTQEVDGLEISNVKLIVREEGSTFTADVTNTTEQEISGNLSIIFKTSTNKEVTRMLGYFGEKISPGETKQISSNTSRKLKDNIIKNVSYELQTQG